MMDVNVTMKTFWRCIPHNNNNQPRKKMKKLATTILITATALATALPVMAQQHPRVSPHETISAVIDGDKVSITYGRPYTVKPGTTEARKIWGGLVPWDKPWRMGADEVTLLVTEQPIVLDGKTVPAGTNTLYMVPSENGTSQLVISTRTSGNGIPVDTAHDVAKVDLKKETLDKSVDQFTMAIDKGESGGGVLKMSWEKTQFTVPFTAAK